MCAHAANYIEIRERHTGATRKQKFAHTMAQREKNKQTKANRYFRFQMNDCERDKM